jgi:signal peptidase I
MQRTMNVVFPSQVRATPGSTGMTGSGVPKTAWRAYGESLAIALLLASAVRGFVLQGFEIPSISMLPTLQAGDHLLINKLRYGVHLPLLDLWLLRYAEPRFGDVVVFDFPLNRSEDYVKRVIAGPGEVVEIRDKRVFVNGEPRDTEYAYFAEGREASPASGLRDNYGPATVPSGHLFVLGDNRDRSYDSRFWGFLPVEAVEGEALAVYWSWDQQDRWVRWERLGGWIH